MSVGSTPAKVGAERILSLAGARTLRSQKIDHAIKLELFGVVEGRAPVIVRNVDVCPVREQQLRDVTAVFGSRRVVQGRQAGLAAEIGVGLVPEQNAHGLESLVDGIFGAVDQLWGHAAYFVRTTAGQPFIDDVLRNGRDQRGCTLRIEDIRLCTHGQQQVELLWSRVPEEREDRWLEVAARVRLLLPSF